MRRKMAQEEEGEGGGGGGGGGGRAPAIAGVRSHSGCACTELSLADARRRRRRRRRRRPPLAGGVRTVHPAARGAPPPGGAGRPIARRSARDADRAAAGVVRRVRGVEAAPGGRRQVDGAGAGGGLSA